MAETMPAVNCPSCGAKGNLPDGFKGSRVKCPRCGSAIAVASKATISPSAKGPEVEHEDDLLRRDAAEPQPPVKPCPFCGETILEVAKKCKHCGELLDPVLRAAQEQRAAQATPAVTVYNASSSNHTATNVNQNVNSNNNLTPLQTFGGCLVFLIATPVTYWLTQRIWGPGAAWWTYCLVWFGVATMMFLPFSKRPS